ncbi:PhoX family protein [Altericroceibacterium xinjiangense]|uniref:PhoX family protein n=1 Tax=Altericroceibacterium xinjiangense TaxID=762261 RepID=UPI000F7F4CD7|nr:PhoX family phosphatase [Altericroceibacterium xinjiangense]
MTDSSIRHGYSDGDVDTNSSELPTLEALAAERFSRRQTLFGGLSASAVAFLGTTALTACSDDDEEQPAPVVTPGLTVAATSGQMVNLTGAPEWSQFAGPEVELVTATDGMTFIAPAVAQATDLEFRVKEAASWVAPKRAKVTVSPAQLSFAAVAKNQADIVTIPAGYSLTVLTALGDPIAAGVPAYANNGTDANFDQRIGDHGDALMFFGLGANGQRNDTYSKRGLLAQNHENLNVQYLHPNGPTNVRSGPRPEAEAIKEINAHGVSVTEVIDNGDLDWAYVQASPFNRRITPNTPMTLHGPVRGTDFVKTAYSPEGTQGRGTINNCANGLTGWGTLLTCEENWAGYFRRDNSGTGTDNAARSARELTSLRRYGVNSTTGNYAWSSVPSSNTIFRRWDARATAASATEDFRNEPNQFGWVVEIDPYDPTSTPRKRTTLGRMGHEGAWLGQLTAGKRVAVYMGDDSRREYFYKFVSDAAWNPSDAQVADRLAVGDKYFDAGTLYVARFNADGTGAWLPLVFGQVPNRQASGSTPEYVFESQADVLVNTRLAADALGATPMDRPEWTALNPRTGEIYLTLTNNNASNRPLNDTNAANPRHYNDPKNGSAQWGNPNGHIVRIRENGDDPAAAAFAWDIYLFGADSADADPANVNVSGLDASNDFSSPDGIRFSRDTNPAGQIRPLLWIQTDDGAFTDRTNNQMLAALPGTVGDGSTQTIVNTGSNGATASQVTRVGADATAATLKRFLTGPSECEITGADTTPDGRTLFVGIQHPGEDGEPDAPTSNWPQSQTGTTSGRPRSGVVAIVKDDGGVVGL